MTEEVGCSELNARLDLVQVGVLSDRDKISKLHKSTVGKMLEQGAQRYRCYGHGASMVVTTACFKIATGKDKNSIRDAHIPQPGEIVSNTMRYRSSETVQRSGYF